MKVLNISQRHYIGGGSDRYYFSLAELLESNGHQVLPFAAANPANLATEGSHYFPDGVDFQSPGPQDIVRFLYSRPAASAMKRVLAEQKPDIAHLHIYYGQLTASILKPLKDAGVPVVQTLHEYKIVCPVYSLNSNGELCEACKGRHFWRAIAKRCNRRSLARSSLSAAESYISRWLGAIEQVDHFLAVSEFLQEKVIELGLPREKITTVHNFLDAAKIKPSKKIGKYFLYFGRLERVKGIFTLLEAAAKLRTVPLIVAGEGEARQAIEAKIRHEKLRHVHLVGFKGGNELEQLIQKSICTIAPSEWYETFGLTLIESFAAGRPVIASRIGGMTEVVTHGLDGFLVTAGDANELRGRMAWMAEHPSQAVTMGLRGRTKVETQFDPESHYSKVMDVYKGVLA